MARNTASRLKLFKVPEFKEQEVVVQWWGLEYPAWDKLLFHIPNGERRSAYTGAKLKRMGVKAGVADLFLAIARGRFHGMFIEMKGVRGGAQAQSQKEFEAAVDAQGFLYIVAYGAGEAIANIKEYLKLGEKDRA